ncbi:MAG TPA: hypothetical protein VHL57_03445, partial [Flavobacteriales bacterium]|nr:hypothetical protein [Flavobacteriales bacterium]
MRTLTLLPALALSLALNAQYGSFDPKAIAAAKNTTTVVVTDAGDSPYNREIMNAVKANWKFTGTFDFINANDLATAGVSPDKTYLVKVRHTDATKYDATFLTLVQGWKMKKGEVLKVEANAVVNMPNTQELAFLMIDPNRLGNDGSALLNTYVKNIQDYLKQVETGKIKDKTTADRLYQSRNRLVKDMDLWFAKEQLDKSLPDLAKLKETYTHQVQLMDLSQQMAAATKGEPNVAIADIVMTGDYKTKWCFRRVFNANTGELMYQRDEAAIAG